MEAVRRQCANRSSCSEFGFRFLFAIPVRTGMFPAWWISRWKRPDLPAWPTMNMDDSIRESAGVGVLLVAALVLALGALFEIKAPSSFIGRRRERRVGASEVISKRAGLAFSSARRIARPSNWLLALFALLLVPLTNLTVTSLRRSPACGFPEFIMDFIWENGALTAVFVIVMAALYRMRFFWRSVSPLHAVRRILDAGTHLEQEPAARQTPGGWRAVWLALFAVFRVGSVSRP